MFKFSWTFLVITSFIILVIIALTSLLFKKTPGTFTNVEKELLPETLYLNKSFDEQKKFESKGEQITRACLESIFNLKFVNKRIPEIKNPNTGKNLELDCYNEFLKLAVEYHGVNHYKFIPFFHKTLEKFYESQERDEYKMQMCKKLGIDLLIVPYNTKHDQICNLLKRELKRIGKTNIYWDNSTNENKE
jgi:hypothetical protein